MKWWARPIVVVLGLVVTGVCGAFLGFLWTGEELVAGRPVLLEFTARLESTVEGRWLATGAAAVLILLAALAIVAAWSTGRHLISVRTGGEREPVLVPTEMLAHHVADAALATEHVESARASVTPDGDGSVAIALELRVDEEAEAGAVVSAVDRRVASALEARYGLHLARRPNVEVRHVTARHRRGDADAARDARAASGAEPGDGTPAR